jgi:hypothetical protein
MLKWDYLTAILPEKREFWARSGPTRYVLIDDFIEASICETLNDLTGVQRKLAQPQKRKHKHVRGKSGTPRRSEMTLNQAAFFDEINSPEFVRYMQDLTGIDPLYPDNDLNGGGLHVSRPGGYLNVHTDFNFHPTTHKNRRLNLLLYLNKDWKDEWNGHIELWDQQLEYPFLRAAPLIGRVLIFETSEDSYHGHPLPLKTPPGVYRSSLAVYYYSEWPAGVSERPQTNYQLIRRQWAELMSRIAHLPGVQTMSIEQVVGALQIDYMTKDIRAAYKALMALPTSGTLQHVQWTDLMLAVGDRLQMKATTEDEVAKDLRAKYEDSDVRTACKTLRSLRSAVTMGEVYWEYPNGVYSLEGPAKVA